MTALDRETLELFERSVRGVLDEAAVDSTARLKEIGWCDILAVDARAVVPMVFKLQGARRARSAILDDVARGALRDPAHTDPDTMYAHPCPGRGAAAAQVDGDRLVVEALAFRAPHPETRVALVATGLDGSFLALVPPGALVRAPVDGLDPSLALTRVSGSVSITAVEIAAVADIDAVARDCRRALAYELIGISSAMLATASEYAGVRTQYGHPIGTFQAVKHRLADVLVAVRAAEVVADESWDSDTAATTTAAKALAGEAFHLAAENCLQVLGAIGFTWEHDLHRYLRRGTVLDALFGSARDLRVELGQDLVTAGRVPRPGVL